MSDEILSEVRKAESQAADIRRTAAEKAANAVADATADAEKRIAQADADARIYKTETLKEISDKAERLIKSEIDEANYDASKIENHAKRVTSKAVAYILEEIAGIKTE